MDNLAQIANSIDEAVTGPVWHGPALEELLDNMTADAAAAHPVETAHSVWELVLHMAAWARIVEQRMTSTTLVEPTHAEEWPAVPPASPQAWRQSIASLHGAYHHLATAVRALPPEALSQRVPGRQHAIRTMLRGIVEHASYHGGQIALLSRAMNAHRGRG